MVTGDPIAAEVLLIFERDAAPDTEIKTFTDANGFFSFESIYISFENEVTYPYLVVLPEFPYSLDFAEGISINEGVATEISFELDNADILLYNGDIGDDYFEYYAEPIETLGVTFHFARKNSGDLLQASRMHELTYPITIWYTGDLVNPVLSATDEDSIISFLDAGGRIFLTGQNIVENLSPTSSLLTDYLNVSYGGKSTTTIVRGIEGNVVTDGLGLFALTGTGSAGNQSSLDILVPMGNAESAMLYGITDETVVAVSVEDTQSGYKIFLTGFGFEGIAATGDNRFEEPISMLANVLTWFGLEVITGINNEVASLPEEYILKQNYPNPFNPITRIEYTLLNPGKVSLIIYNILGEEVTRLVDGEMPAGEHTSIWNASILSSGIYFYRLQAGDIVRTRKMVLLK